MRPKAASFQSSRMQTERRLPMEHGNQSRAMQNDVKTRLATKRARPLHDQIKTTSTSVKAAKMPHNIGP
jgi:hypothetical protein